MRIVSVCRVYPTQRPGGMPFVCQDRAEELARQGHEVHVLTTSRNPHTVEFVEEVNGVSVHHLPCKPQTYTKEFAETCADVCVRLAPDILHLDSFDRERVWWKERPGNPKVVAVTMHGNAVGTELTKWNLFREGIEHNVRSIDFRDMDLERVGLKKADRVLAVSRSEEWQLTDVMGLLQTRRVYNPIAPYFFSRPRTPIKTGAPFLCAAISGHKQRGFSFAREIAGRCGRELRIVSDVPRQDMPNVYDECAAVLLPTLFAQGYDLTVAEANARGRLVYATATGSYLREYDEGPAICLARGYSVNGFVETIKATEPLGWLEGEWFVGEYWGNGRHRPDKHVKNWLEALNV